MNYKLRRTSAIILCMTMFLSLTACNNNMSADTKESSGYNANTSSSGSQTTGNIVSGSYTNITPLAANEMFTDRDLDAGYDLQSAIPVNLADNASTCNNASVSISDNTVTISGEGTYILSGTLTNGQIIVEAADTDKVQLVLNEVSISSVDTASINIKTADKVFITLADNTKNSLTMSGTFPETDSIDGVIFSKSDLTLNGSGVLDISAADGHGIVSKDDLKITMGTYNITAASSGLSGKDSLRIADGTFNITSGKDALHSENADDTDKGYIYITGGTFNITAEGDGLDSSSILQIENGSFNITSASKALKSDTALFVADGTFNINATDDALHTNGSLEINGGTFTIATQDDGIHADADLFINAGTIDITESYEGIEGNTITVNGGDIRLVSKDDGLNAAGGQDGSGFARGGFEKSDFFNQGANTNPNSDSKSGDIQNRPDRGNKNNMIEGMTMPEGMTPPDMNNISENMTPPDMNNMSENMTPPDMNNMPENMSTTDMSNSGQDSTASTTDDSFTNNTTPVITINGGTLVINADGDGIDSNGNLIVNGGTTYIMGPTNSGNGAIDYESTGTINGGTFVAMGAAGMAMNFGSASTQGSMLVNISGQVGDTITLCDANGSSLLSVTSEKSFGCVTISCPEITKDSTYTVACGDNSVSVTMTDLIYSEGGGFGGFGGHGGGPGGFNGQSVDIPNGGGQGNLSDGQNNFKQNKGNKVQ